MSRPETQVFFVSGVCCSTEEAVVRKTMDVLAGADGYRFNALTGELTVTAPVIAGSVVRGLRGAGFGARSRQDLQQEAPFVQRHAAGLWTAGSGLLAAAGMAAEYAGADGIAVRLLLGGAIVAGGWNIGRKALGALRTRTLDMNVLMSLAVIGALFIGKWSEGAAVVVLFSLALMLESYSVSRTRRAIRSLMAISPLQASVLHGEEERTVPAADITPGEIVVIRPGERVPLDGVIMTGSSRVDQSPITGEATPVPKHPGDPVYAGTINGQGALHVRVTTRSEDTTLARIVHLVEEAEHKRAPVQTMVDRFARAYTPAVLALGVLVALLPPMLAGAEFSVWLYRALVLLVIACPCALVISTPVTIVSALTNAARRGILIKGGVHLETLGTVRAVAFDKTGTLTEGKIRVTDVVSLNGMGREEILSIVWALEAGSEHHLADAMVTEAVRSNVPAPVRADRFEAVPGRGVRGVIGGSLHVLGNLDLVREMGVRDAGLAERLQEFSAQGQTTSVLARAGEPLAIVALSDGIRPQSGETVAHLRREGISHVCMITGDQAPAAERLAGALGIEQVHAALLPAQKVEIVERLCRQYGTVAMVGDGINDAPALAASSVGIAMGVGGTDAALETADVVLMSDDLGKLPFLFALGRATMRIIRQNIALALGLKFLFLLLSISGYATLWMALLADDGAALLVIANGLRALSFRDHA